MTEVELDVPFDHVVALCGQYIGERKYYLHRRAGGVGWEVCTSTGRNSNGVLTNCTRVKFADSSIATFILLKLGR